MFEVYPDNQGRWILYEVGGGNFDVVAWFADKDDAEFARGSFATREALAASARGAGKPADWRSITPDY